MKKIAFVHDWLVSYRGGEKVLNCLLNLFPDAPLYSLFYDKKSMPVTINKRDIHVPFVLKPFIKIRKAMLPLFPILLEFWPGKKFDLVVSTSSCVAKSVHAQKHVCYIHSPMRYIWDQEEIYLEPLKKWPLLPQMIRTMNALLRYWDRKTAKRVDLFICNSNFVAQRVQKFYKRDSIVIHPPIEDSFLNSPRSEKKSYYIAAGALVWYKRFDLAIAACEKKGVPLIIAGNGPYLSQLQKMAGPNTKIVVSPSNEEFRQLLAEAKGLLFPGVEDFGLIAIESMALGTPVIAYRAGGALDFVNSKTGMFFDDQSAESIAKTIEAFEKTEYSYDDLHKFAGQFSEESFLAKFKHELDKVT